MYIRCGKKFYLFPLNDVIWIKVEFMLLILVQENTADYTLQTDYMRKILSLNILKN